MYDLEAVEQDSVAFRRAIRLKQAYVPLYAKIKIIYGCNLRCEMCKHWQEPREAPLAMDRLYRLVEELSDLGCRKIHLTGGEPLLRAQVPELIRRASLLGIRANMTTNGTLVSKDRARELVDAGLRGVNISVDSPVRKIHDRVRGAHGAWKKTTRAIEYFRRAGRKGKLAVRINTVVSRQNYRSLSSLPDFAAELGAEAIHLIPVDDHCGKHLSPGLSHLRNFNETIAPVIAERALALGLISDERQAYPFGRTEEELRRARRGQFAQGWYDRHPCFAPWTHALIDHNGLVYICCMTREQIPPLGDIKTSSFADVWTGLGFQAARNSMHPPQLEPCRRCDDFLAENRRLLEITDDRKKPLLREAAG